jgi:hypothetical protein
MGLEADPFQFTRSRGLWSSIFESTSRRLSGE